MQHEQLSITSLHGDPMQNILLVVQVVAHLVAKVQAVLD
jgi:hypothetical protein